MNPHSKPQPNEEQRLMALLALDAQEPPKPGSLDSLDLANLDPKSLSSKEIQDLHSYLDAHPEAFEALLRRRSKAVSQPATAPRSWRTWLAGWQPVPRYAMGLGVAAACAVLISLATIDRPGAPNSDVQQAFAELSRHMPARSFADVSETAPRAETRLGFSGSTRHNPSATASFAAGVEQGKTRLMQQDAPVAEPQVADEAMYVLGQWNTLLSAACQAREPLATEFWRAQQTRFHEFADQERDGRVDALVDAHLQRVESLLLQLSERNAGRAAYELSQELQLFRERFSP